MTKAEKVDVFVLVLIGVAIFCFYMAAVTY